MKKILQSIGFATIMCLSFFYTEKAVEVVKEYDEVYQKIVDVSNNYKKDPIDAYINDNTIIPGISGKSVNVDLSYSKMKRYGKYNDSLIVLSDIKPNISIDDNKNKFIISGNKKNNYVSLLFLIKDSKNLKYILNILDEKNISCDLFFFFFFIENNIDEFNKLNLKHNIGNFSYNKDYSNSSFPWLDSIIKKKINKDYTFCYSDNNKTDIASICSLSNDFTVVPNIILKNNFVSNVKDKLQNGSIISITINDSNKSELPILINYIISKGYEIKTLNEHLSE